MHTHVSLELQDKAIKRFQVRNMVDASSLRDIKDASAYEVYVLPKMYANVSYCVSCAVHRRIVRGRSAIARRVRTAPVRRRRRPDEKKSFKKTVE